MVERCIDLLLCYHGAGRRDGSRPFGGLVCRFHGAEGRADPVSEAMNCLKIRWVERFHSVNYCPPQRGNYRLGELPLSYEWTVSITS